MFRHQILIVSFLVLTGVGLSTQAMSAPTQISRPSTTQSTSSKASAARSATPKTTTSSSNSARRVSTSTSARTTTKPAASNKQSAARVNSSKSTTSTPARRVTSTKTNTTTRATTTARTPATKRVATTPARKTTNYVAVSSRTYFLPTRTRPTRIYSRTPVVYYATSDRLTLQREISDLRVAIQQERVRTGLYMPAVDNSLTDALIALDETENMLRWGYSRSQVLAGIADARSLLSYARNERSYVWAAVDNYRNHAQAQIALAERNLVYSTYRSTAMRDLDAARAAMRDAQYAESRRLNADEIIAAWQRAADYADRAAYTAMS